MSTNPPDDEVRLSKPLPAAPGGKAAGPSLALSTIFALGMTAIVVPLVGFVVSVTLGWQGGLNVFTTALKWSFHVIGALLAYGMLVGLYHTFLAMTGLDRGPRKS
jgi:hypothetical protein